ncbi:MAG: 2-phospho-L-lactate transferase [Acidobacteria bacterium]|nr:MAG: 2-phospho-L-lactate transferase [Acidobacteriota bacterium]
MSRRRVLALSGGVGGAKLARGLAAALDPEALLVVCNTGDDFEHLGLHVSPDVDSVLYALADVNDAERGWGRRDESWNFLETLRQLRPDEAWFQLGDRDLATHVLRTARLRRGDTLSTVTDELRRGLGVACTVAPMSDDLISTVVETDEGDLPFQEYFVRRRCEPAFRGMRLEGIEGAWPAPLFSQWLEHPDLGAVVICPSNPYVSVDPILAVPGALHRIAKSRRRGVPVVAVSPIVGGEALKGPAAKMLRELGHQASALAVARHYTERDLLDGFVLDRADAALEGAVAELGVRVLVTDTVMRSADDSQRLARELLATFASSY